MGEEFIGANSERAIRFAGVFWRRYILLQFLPVIVTSYTCANG